MSKDEKPKKPGESLRQRAEKAGQEPRQPRRLHRTARSAARPFKAAARVGRKEIYPIKPRDKGFAGFMTKRRRFTPAYFRNAWNELRQVEWPSRKETWKLTLAVFTFAVVFGVIISAADYGLDKLFRKVLLK